MALARSCGAESVATLHDAVADPTTDAVYIATLPDTHASIAQTALRHGKAVLCEKPVVVNSRELEAVLALARERGLLFMEAMKPPFFPVYRRLREHLQRDPIGRILEVRSGFATVTQSQHPSWLLEAAGGSMMGIGVYHAFLSVDWLGPASEVRAEGLLSARGVDAFASVRTSHASRHAEWFSGMDRDASAGATLIAEQGTITLPGAWWRPDIINLQYNDGRLVTLHEPAVGNGFQYETEHFCDLLRSFETESTVMTHAHSRATMAILDQARSDLGVRFAADH
jgi:predicted dehydrogenase